MTNEKKCRKDEEGVSGYSILSVIIMNGEPAVRQHSSTGLIVFSSFACTLLAVLIVTATADDNASGYLNDPFTRPGIITPYTLPEAWPVHFDRNPHNLSPEDADTRLVVLGTGLPNANPYRFGPAYAVVANDQPYLVDAGEGIWRALAKAALINGDEINQALAPIKLNYLFVTHLHEDHTVGIPSLILNPFKINIPAPKSIYGPKGIDKMVEHILEAWKIDIAAELSDGYDPIGAEATGYNIDVDQQGLVYQDDNVTVEAFRTIHGPLQDTFAYRFTTPDRIITFTGDGGPYHENIVKAAMNADLLVTEAVTEENIGYAHWGGDTVEEKKKEIFRYHYSPAVLARIANEAQVKTIVLSHEQNYTSPEEFTRTGLRDEIIAAGYEGPIYSAMDGDVY